ncbi:MAG: hypothetical protein JWO38_7947 [Gemmataceae bacterium]|nr:hypothetical protein [Gemmataceae bacterium]
MVSGVFIAVAVGGLFWLAYRRPRPRRWLLPRRTGVSAYPGARAAVPEPVSVERQHRHLQAGGLIGETTFEATKTRLRGLLAAGRTAEVEGGLRPGLGFAVQVRALAEIGTPEAGLLLERQLERPVSRDPAEQSWYWVDVAAGLRKLNRATALPAVLRCADAAAGLQQGVVLSAEAVAFPTFPALLRDIQSPAGRLAVRALGRSARGCRDGTIDPASLVRAGLGDHLAAVAETALPVADPWLTTAVLEAERIARRLEHWSRLLAADARQLAERQCARLAASAVRRKGWLGGAVRRLVGRFTSVPVEEQTATLHALADLRADVSVLFPDLPRRREAWWAEAVRCLRWSKSRGLGPVLARRASALLRRSWRGRPGSEVLLGALCGHRCDDAEAVLLKAAGARHPDTRQAAVAAFGWWDPFDTSAVVNVLQARRTDRDPGVRRAAVGALARLGERSALREFVAGFAAEDTSLRQSVVLTAAEEGITWLWPELDALADSSDRDTALAAVEALEQMREHLFGPVG